MKKANKFDLSYKIPSVEEIPTEKNKYFPIPKGELDELRERSNDRLLFSFRFFNRKIEEFNLGETFRVCDNWFLLLFDIMKEVSSLNRNQLVIDQRQHYDAHGHKWEELHLKYPFGDDFLQQVECLQFRLSQGRGRVHGFIVGNHFYVVWLDPHHNLYPDEKHGGIKLYKTPSSCDELLETEILRLNQEISNINEEKHRIQHELGMSLDEHENTLVELESLKKHVEENKFKDDVKRIKQEKYNKKVNRRHRN